MAGEPLFRKEAPIFGDFGFDIIAGLQFFKIFVDENPARSAAPEATTAVIDLQIRPESGFQDRLPWTRFDRFSVDFKTDGFHLKWAPGIDY